MPSYEVISPFDSGSWSGLCNHSFEPPKHTYGHNCSAYAGREGLGTFEALEHLFGINEAYWGSEAFLKPLARLLGDASYKGEDLVKYFEAPLCFIRTLGVRDKGHVMPRNSMLLVCLAVFLKHLDMRMGLSC